MGVLLCMCPDSVGHVRVGPPKMVYATIDQAEKHTHPMSTDKMAKTITSRSRLYTEWFQLDHTANAPVPKIVVVGDRMSGRKALLQRLLAYPVPRTSSFSILFRLRNDESLSQDSAYIQANDSIGNIICEERRMESKEAAVHMYPEILAAVERLSRSNVETTIMVTLSGADFADLDILLLPTLNKSENDPDQKLVRESLRQLFAESETKRNIFFLLMVPMNTRPNQAAVMDVYAAAQKALSSNHIYPGLVVYTKFTQCQEVGDSSWCDSFMTRATDPKIILFKSPQFVCIDIEASAEDSAPPSEIWSVPTASLDRNEGSLFSASSPFITALREQHRATCDTLISNIAAFCTDLQIYEYMPLFIFRLLVVLEGKATSDADINVRTVRKLGTASEEEKKLQRALEYVAKSFAGITIRKLSDTSGSQSRTLALNKLMCRIIEAFQANARSVLQKELSTLWAVSLKLCSIPAGSVSTVSLDITTSTKTVNGSAEVGAAAGVENLVGPVEKCVFVLLARRRCTVATDYLLNPTKPAAYGDEMDISTLPWQCECTIGGESFRCHRENDESGAWFSFIIPRGQPESNDKDRHVTLLISLHGAVVKSQFLIPGRGRPPPAATPETPPVTPATSSHMRNQGASSLASLVGAGKQPTSKRKRGTGGWNNRANSSSSSRSDKASHVVAGLHAGYFGALGETGACGLVNTLSSDDKSGANGDASASTDNTAHFIESMNPVEIVLDITPDREQPSEDASATSAAVSIDEKSQGESPPNADTGLHGAYFGEDRAYSLEDKEQSPSNIHSEISIMASTPTSPVNDAVEKLFPPAVHQLTDLLDFGVHSLTHLPPLLYYDAGSHDVGEERNYAFNLFVENVNCRKVKYIYNLPTIVLTGEANCGKRSLLARLVGFPVPRSDYDVPILFRIRRNPFYSSTTPTTPTKASVKVIRAKSKDVIYAEQTIDTRMSAATVYENMFSRIVGKCQMQEVVIIVTLKGWNYPNLDVQFFPSMHLFEKNLEKHIAKSSEYSTYLFALKASSRNKVSPVFWKYISKKNVRIHNPRCTTSNI